MKKISLILALVMIFSTMLMLASCGSDSSADAEETKQTSSDNENEAAEGIDPADAVLADLVEKVKESVPYDEYVSEFLYKESDPDEMVCWTYGVIDINAYDLLCDYAITLPSDYCNTLAVLKFEDGMTKEDFDQVKEVVTTEYIRAQASALQMYMPEQYACMSWALENPQAIWRQYGDNVLVLAITGDSEATDVWEAIDAYFAG